MVLGPRAARFKIAIAWPDLRFDADGKQLTAVLDIPGSAACGPGLQARCACSSSDSGSYQFATGKVIHGWSIPETARPVVIARMRFLNPALQTITIWMTTNITRSTETKK